MHMLQLIADQQLQTHKYALPEDKEQVTYVSILLVKAICNGRGCGLIDDAQHLQASNGASILGGLQ